MRTVCVGLALSFFLKNLPTGCYCNNATNEIKENWEKTYQLLKNANTEAEVLRATADFRDTRPNDARFMEPNNMYSDLALYLCALKVIRMVIDEAYEKDIRPNAKAAQPSSNLDAQAEVWRDYFRENQKPDEFAGRVREAYKYLKVFDDSYAAPFGLSAVRTADLCRRYEPKIPEMQATYESYLKKNDKKLALWDVLKSDINWNMTYDDVYTAYRIFHARNRTIFTWLWLDQDEKIVIPFCANHQLFHYKSVYTSR